MKVRDLSPYGPIMIAPGIYAVILALLAEGFRGISKLHALFKARRAARGLASPALRATQAAR